MTETDAGEAYREKTSEVKQEAYALLRALGAHGRQAEAQPKDWRYSGDMGHVLELIRELNAFLGAHEERVLLHPCPHCGREEDGRWFAPCPADDCPSNVDPGAVRCEKEHRAILKLQWRLKALKKVEGLAFLADEEEVVGRDTLADLMHWGEERGIDFEEELRIARNHFAEEKEGLE